MAQNSAPNPSPNSSSQAGGRSWLLPLITGALALGVGITGTLLYIESRPPAATATPTVVPAPAADMPAMSGNLDLPVSGDKAAAGGGASSAAPSTADAGANEGEPPMSLTSGMDSAQAALTLGNWYYDNQNWPKAIVNYKAAVTGGLESPDVLTDLGSALRFSGHPQDALDQYQRAQKLDPNHENSLFNQGGVYYFSLHETDRAIATWKEYLRRFPKGKNIKDARTLIAKASKK